MKLNEARTKLLARRGLLMGATASVASVATGIGLLLGGGSGPLRSPERLARALPAPVEAVTTSTTPVTLNEPVVGMASTPDGGGYWLVASDGGVFTFGDARYFGSTGGVKLNEPVVGMAATADGRGYWLVASDGGVFTFGDARYSGSTGGIKLNSPVVGMAAAPDGGGYWLVASDGGIFNFGDVRYFGSTGGTKLNRPVVGMADTRNGSGYWLVASDGGIFNFGAAPFRGSEAAASAGSVVGMARSAKTGGYWMSGRDGSVFALGAPSFGSIGGGYSSAALGAAIVRLASSQLGQTNAALYGGSGGEWCAAFASWVYRNAGLPIGVLTAAYQIGTWAQSGGGTLLPPSATPEPGDAVLFEPNGSGLSWPGPGLDISNIAHVNIVASVNPDGSFTTIGGNESAGGASAVRQQGPYSVANAPSWWGQTVYGFVRPG